MPVGIKYCGGCRSAYDRKAEAERVMAAAPDIVFESAVPGRHYDAVLAVCGCRSRCADVSVFTADRIVYISEEGGAAAAAQEIKATQEGKE